MRLPVEAADTHPWQFYVTPYLWVAGVSGTMTTANPRLPDQEISAGFGDMLSHLDAIPVMGSFEARYAESRAGHDVPWPNQKYFDTLVNRNFVMPSRAQ